MSWAKARLNSLIDNLIWVVVLLVAAVVGVPSLLAYGGRQTDLPVWVVVLFGATLLACVVSVAVLARRFHDVLATLDSRNTLEQRAPHPRAALLRRIDALSKAAERRDPTYPAEWPAAAAFNGILRDAREETQHDLLGEIDELQRGGSAEGWDTIAYSATYGTLTTLLAQIRAIVE